MVRNASWLSCATLLALVIGLIPAKANKLQDSTIEPEKAPIFRESVDEQMLADDKEWQEQVQRAYEKSIPKRYASSRALNRLLRTLKNVRKSKLYKDNLISLVIRDDDFFHWQVTVSSNLVPRDSIVYEDLMRLRAAGKPDNLILKVYFKDRHMDLDPTVSITYPNYRSNEGLTCITIIDMARGADIEALILSMLTFIVENKYRLSA